MCTFKCCGIFCMGLSLFCGIALLIVGIFLTLESPSIHVPIVAPATHPDYQAAATNCFVGLGIYAVIFALSVGCVCIDRFKKRRNPLDQPLLNQQAGYAPQVDSARSDYH